MRALLIHQAFVTGHEPGGTRHLEFGERLAVVGDRLTVVASQVSYQTGKRADSSRGGLMYREHVQGVDVLRAYAPSVVHRGFRWRVFGFLVFSLTSLVAALRVDDIEVVMGTSPPIFQAFTAWLVARVKRKPFLLEIRDLWPEFAIEMGALTNPLARWAGRRGERFLFRHSDHFLVNSPAYRTYLLSNGIPNHLISEVPNGADVMMFTPFAERSGVRSRFGLEEKFLVVYAGALGMANDLKTVLEAARTLQEHTGIHFLFVGDGKERGNLEAQAKVLGLANVTFTGSIPKTEMPGVLVEADACLASLLNIPLFTTTYPNKVFDYMAAGKPVVLGIDGVIRAVIEEANAGIYAAPGDAEALAKAILQLFTTPGLGNEMGKNGRESVVERFSRDIQADEFRRVLYHVSSLRERAGAAQSPERGDAE